MKTLKKSLCLVLALVMILGLGVISASADLDYEDAKDVTYAEAVDVMSGIGVLEGYEDGTFLPTQEVTREEAAKIIAYLLIGNAKQADALSTTSAPFTDVSAQRWSAGYIAYCVQRGIIDGMGDGTFDPTGKVTGLQFAKMLLCALGYGVNDEYTGEAWAISASKDALNLGIFDGNLAGATNTPATREECAQYAFNALWLQKVTYSALLGGYIERTWGNSAEANKSDTIAADYRLVVENNANDAFYRPGGIYYTVDGDKITDIYYRDADLVASYTTPVTGKELYNVIGANILANAKKNNSVNVYIDGYQWSATYPANDAKEVISKTNTSDAFESGYGVQTYVYVIKDDNGTATARDDSYEVRIVEINTYLGKVTKVLSETAKREAATTIQIADIVDDNGKSYEYAADRIVNGPNGMGSSGTYKTEEFAKNDYVLFTYSRKTGEIESVEAVETVTGEMTGHTNKNGYTYITVDDDTKYTAAKIDCVFDADDQIRVSDIGLDEDALEYTFLLDSYGYMIGATPVKTTSEYVYVAQFGQKVNTNGKLNDVTSLLAEVYFADGTSDTVTVEASNLFRNFNTKSINNNNSDLIDDWNAVDEYGVPENDSLIGLYKLTYNDKDQAVLTRPNANTSVAGKESYWIQSEHYDITKGIDFLTNTNYATSKTVFFYVSGIYGNRDNPLSVVVKVGIANAITTNDKTYENGVVEGFFTANDTETEYKASALLATGKAEVNNGKDVYYYAGQYDVSGKVVTYDVYDVNGELTEIQYTYASNTKARDAAKVAPEGFVVKGEDNLVVAPATTKTVTEQAVVNLKNGTLYVGSARYDVNGAVVIDLTDRDIFTLDDIQAGNTVSFTYNDKTLKVDVIYVVA